MIKTAYSPKMQTFDYIKERDVLNVGDVWEVVAELKPGMREPGTYRIDIDMSYTFDRTTTSAEFGFSSDGGVTWNDFTEEPKDKTDVSPFNYGYPFELTHPYPHFIFRAKKETGAGDLDILFLDLSMERKG